MGIQVEFNPDLALRKYNTKSRLESECLPENLEPGKVYSFLKKGQRNYYLKGEIPLLETKGNQRLGRPLASITILEATHEIDPKSNKIMTSGKYLVNEVFDLTNEIHRIQFESYKRIKYPKIK